MQHRHIILASIIVGVVAVFGARLAVKPARAQDQTDTLDTERPLMRQKLDYSQKVLEGLTTNDMKLVIEGGDALLSFATLDQWGRFLENDPEYERLSETFKDSVARMIQAAEDKNLEGATLRHMQATMACVQCHERMRDSK